jgi:hypothetical protein
LGKRIDVINQKYSGMIEESLKKIRAASLLIWKSIFSTNSNRTIDSPLELIKIEVATGIMNSIGFDVTDFSPWNIPLCGS